jgi:hypothetical protein
LDIGGAGGDEPAGGIEAEGKAGDENADAEAEEDIGEKMGIVENPLGGGEGGDCHEYGAGARVEP